MLLKHIAALATTLVSGRVIRFLYLIIAARFLPSEEIGIYLYGIALYLGVSGLSQFGQHIFLSERLGKHPRLPFPVARNSLFLTIITTLASTLALAIYVLATEPTDELRLIMMFFVASLFARSFTTWVRLVYISIEKPQWIPRYEIIFRGTEALCGIAALSAGGGLLSLTVIHFLSWTIETYFSFIKLSKDYPGLIKITSRPRYLYQAVSVSKYYFAGSASLALFPQIAILISRNMEDSSSFFPFFAISMQFFTVFLIIPEVVSRVFMPRLSLAYARSRVGDELPLAIRLIGIFSLTTAIIGASLGPLAIHLAFGQSYSEAAKIFTWLSWTTIPYSLAIFIGQSLNVLGLRKQSTAIMLLMLVAHASILIAFAHKDIAMATIGSLFVSTFIGAHLSAYYIDKKLSLGILQSWIRLVIVSTIFFFAWTYIEQPITRTLVLLPALAATVYYINMLGKDDIRRIYAIISRSGNKTRRQGPS